VLYVNRPVHAQELAAGTIFKLDATGNEATRTTVRFGRGSVSTIEVTQGLQERDKVILSDMSAWDDHDRVRLK
jgi:HlyD family secretion protein